MANASARLEFRISPASRALIERAAELSGEQPTAFARAAAEERAERVVREHDEATIVPSAYFDELLAALDAPPTPNVALADAFARMRDRVTRD
jgi:uncharacterized protein (DUF1778 family)